MNRTIAYITDIHLDEDASFEKGINPRLNLKKILDDIESRGVEEVIFGGDIGEPYAYRSFFDSLEKFRLRITPGNHDSKIAVRGFFRTEASADRLEWYEASEDDHYKYLLLDSSAGLLSPEQFSWLEHEVRSEKPLVIFIHHPILPVDTAIDAEYPLFGRERIAALLQDTGKQVTVFTGHYHMAHEQMVGNIRQLISPAASFQLRESEKVEIDTSFFGYRLITMMEERSVTRAARRMNVSQPAMSAALGRLRDYFQDEILVTHGKQMYPTAHAEGLIAPVSQFLGDLDALLVSTARFDPSSTQRSFRIVASDYITASVIGPLSQRLAETAPGVRLEMMLPSEEAAQLVLEGKADLIITPEDFIVPGQPTELLCEERQLVIGWSDNPAFADGIDAATFGALGHVAVHVGSNRVPSFADRQIERMGLDRRVDLTCGCFTMVPWLICGTNRIAIMHERLARQMAAQFPLALSDMPFRFPVMREMLQYHRAREADEGLRWLRQQLQLQAANP